MTYNINDIKELLYSKDIRDIRLKHFLYISLILWSLIVSSSLLFAVLQNKHSIDNIAENIARANFEKDQAFRSWAASHGGVYVPANKRTPPNPHLSHIPYRDITRPDGTKLTLMNPAYMVRQMSNEYSGLYGAKSKITSLKYLNEINKPDEWEIDALKSFEHGNKEKFEFTKIGDEPYLRLMRPMYTKKSCLKCHGFQGYKVGDIRGGVGVSLPLKDLYTVSDKNKLMFIFLYSLIWLLGIVGIFIFSFREFLYLKKTKKAKEHLEAIFDATPNIMVTTDGNQIHKGNIAMLEFTGYDSLNSFKKENHCICNMFLEEEGLLHAKMGELNWLEYVLSNPDELHKVRMKKDGKIYSFILLARKLQLDADNDSLVVFNDITEVEYAIKELKEKDEIMIAQSRHAAMGEMISMIAHQWRQPISAIAMDANNILADIGLDMLDSESLNSVSKDIIRQTQELSKTIDDFKNFFRPGKTAEEISIEDVFNEAFSVVGKSLENNNIEVKKEFKTSNKITTYSRELMQVIINIVKNAKEALVANDIEDKEIDISVEEESNIFTIKICDNAGGVDKDIVHQIFNPYFTTKNEKQGTGLGLYMSKTIVEKHLKGKIEVTNIESGACFQITLPKAL